MSGEPPTIAPLDARSPTHSRRRPSQRPPIVPAPPGAGRCGPEDALGQQFVRGAASVDDRWSLLGDESYAVSGSLGSALVGDRGIPALNLRFKRDQDARCVSEALFAGFDALANGRSELPRHRRSLISGMSEHAVPEGYHSIAQIGRAHV